MSLPPNGCYTREGPTFSPPLYKYAMAMIQQKGFEEQQMMMISSKSDEEVRPRDTLILNPVK